MRPYLLPTRRPIQSHLQFVTGFQLFCGVVQCLSDTNPSRYRLMFDFIGQGMLCVHSQPTFSLTPPQTTLYLNGTCYTLMRSSGSCM